MNEFKQITKVRLPYDMRNKNPSRPWLYISIYWKSRKAKIYKFSKEKISFGKVACNVRTNRIRYLAV